ncbi:MAG: neutral zinc metallopeptidase, partial [Jatrophihabitans sp.]
PRTEHLLVRVRDVGRIRALSCLNRAWSAQLARIGLTLVAPHAVFSNSSTQSANPCGTTGNIGYVPFAFYCSVNQTMYFSTYAADRLPLSNYREYLMATPAHEYGHHIQQVLGIMGVYSQRYQDAYPSVAATTLLSRRVELQAQCFEGLFVGRNFGSMSMNGGRVADSEAHTGDNAVAGYKTHPEYRTHGSYRSNNYWATLQGFDSGSAGHCNTWTAAMSTVS